jgi:hypothetical protein
MARNSLTNALISTEQCYVRYKVALGGMLSMPVGTSTSPIVRQYGPPPDVSERCSMHIVISCEGSQ